MVIAALLGSVWVRAEGIEKGGLEMSDVRFFWKRSLVGIALLGILGPGKGISSAAEPPGEVCTTDEAVQPGAPALVDRVETLERMMKDLVTEMRALRASLDGQDPSKENRSWGAEEVEAYHQLMKARQKATSAGKNAVWAKLLGENLKQHQDVFRAYEAALEAHQKDTANRHLDLGEVAKSQAQLLKDLQAVQLQSAKEQAAREKQQLLQEQQFLQQQELLQKLGYLSAGEAERQRKEQQKAAKLQSQAETVAARLQTLDREYARQLDLSEKERRSQEEKLTMKIAELEVRNAELEARCAALQARIQELEKAASERSSYPPMR
jgi:hypothetical protein